MIDTALLAFTIGMMAYICVRAVLLDRTLPWFPPAPKPDAHGPASTPTGREHGQAAGARVGWRART